ncbi:MAG TPA: malectin domain-containing carbohydrate-binding protein [Terriglobales bacterium]|nr:malectin domain-containing carbohydrate-binding protein [Terriglobales bacterium]
MNTPHRNLDVQDSAAAKCKRWTAKLPCILVMLLWASVQTPAAAQVKITPASPPGVAAGACFQFSANYPGTWSVTCRGAGCQAGKIDAAGLYCAPAAVVAKNQSRGCQLGPNNNAYNIPVNKLPVSPYSARWLNRIAGENDGGNVSWVFHRFHVPTPGMLSLYDNVVDNSTPKQKRHFYYGGPWQDTEFAQPLPPNIEMESGWSVDVNAGLDRHMFAINRQTCDDEEIYNDYIDFKSAKISKGNPTIVKFTTETIRPLQDPLRVYISGLAASCPLNGPQMAKVVSPSELQIPVDSSSCGLYGAQISGIMVNCMACNSQGGAHWPAASNAILYGVDAAGSPMSRTSIHPQEWWNAVQRHILDPACNCVTLGHAIRTTLTNSDIAPADLWPSINGHAVTWGHPYIRPLKIDKNNPAEFVLSPNECNGQSYLQCIKPCDNWTFSIGCRFSVVLGGATGAWSQVNGKHYVAEVTGPATFIIPLNTSGHSLPDGLFFYFDWAPYGARFRLKPSFNVEAFCNDNSLNSKCPYEKALLNTIQVYGLILLDGTYPADNWDSNIVSEEFFPDPLVDSIDDMNHSPALGFNPKWPAGGGFEQYLEVVDASSLQVTHDFNLLGTTDYGRVIVTIDSPGHGTAAMDVNLLGTAVGVARSRMAIAAMAGNSYQIDAWVNGNANPGLTYTMSPAVPGASVSRSGLIKPPSSLGATVKTTVTVCSAAAGASNACAYIDVYFIPVSSDGNIRLWVGGHTPSYTDRAHNAWWGEPVPRQFNSNYEIADGVNFSSLNGTWGANTKNWADTPDARLFAESTSLSNDMLLNIAVPNGTYALTLYGEPGYGTEKAGQNVFDLEIGGQVVASYLDAFTLAGGRFHGWTKQVKATVSNGILEVGERLRVASVYGVSLSSLEIHPEKAR